MKQQTNSQPFKAQMMVLKRHFHNKRPRRSKANLRKYTATFNTAQLDWCLNIRDFMYKHDYFTPRKGVLMHPDMYLYYLYQVISICYKLWKNYDAFSDDGDVFSFSRGKVKVFYSGKLSFVKHFKISADRAGYKESYKDFQYYRAKFQGTRVLKIDIQDFFVNINFDKLFETLDKLNVMGKYDFRGEIYSLQRIFTESKYTSLPQVEGSIASSLLSQIYLMPFTARLNEIASKEDLTVARYVDDMYISLPKKFTDKQVHELENQISSELWKLGLNLNSNKIELYSVNKYKNLTTYNLDQSDSFGRKFVSPQYIQEKIMNLLSNDGEQVRSFWDEVSKLYVKKGIDLVRYGHLVNKYFSIKNDDANKVIKGLVFGNKWKANLSIKTKKVLIDRPEIILFDPGTFVMVLLQFEKNYQEVSQNRGYFPVENFIRQIHTESSRYSVREGLVDTAYFIQNKNFLDSEEVQRKILNLNFEYLKFLQDFYVGSNTRK